jgi:phage repressor protein C with HTH and peptisase S24 domain
MKHNDIWRAIDLLAESHGLSASGLARKAGLDATCFNPSKRATSEGRPRWPTTESLMKILESTGDSFQNFAHLLAGTTAEVAQNPSITVRTRRIPIIGCAQAGANGFFDDAGYPTGTGWDTIDFPHKVDAPNLFALEVSGESMEPVYRDGDTLIVSPNTENFRKGDRVVVRTKKGEVMAKQLQRLTAQQAVLKSLNPTYPDITLPRNQIMWLARVLWVSQ